VKTVKWHLSYTALFLTFFLVLLSGLSTAHGKQTVVTVPLRGSLTSSYLLEVPNEGSVEKILLILPGGKGVIKLRNGKDGAVWHEASDDPFVKVTPRLLGRSIAVALLDAPSYATAYLPYSWRRDRVYLNDLSVVVKDLRKRYDKAQIYLAGTGAGGVSAVFEAGIAQKELGGVILAGADAGMILDEEPPTIKIPVLVIHNMKDNCEYASVLDAKSLADKFSYTFVSVSESQDSKDPPFCDFLSPKKALCDDEEFADLVATWIEKGAVPSRPESNETPYLNERILWVPVESGPKGIKLQTTVFKPDGSGPFPLIMINHGTYPDWALAGRLRYRSRYAAQAKEFVSRGFAVALPMRRGYGSSQGLADLYVPSFSAYGLQDARDLRTVADYLAGHEPYVDGGRLILFGISGGGFASLAYGSLAPPNLKGIVNFSGGMGTRGPRSDFDMAEAFGEYAKTTKVASLWFYPENDSVVKLSAGRMAYKEYQKNGGRADMITPPPFKTEGHNLFADPEGISLWLDKVLEFFTRINVYSQP
jgi:pimeloyl-ACP methyl ester carboxylesterase